MGMEREALEIKVLERSVIVMTAKRLIQLKPAEHHITCRKGEQKFLRKAPLTTATMCEQMKVTLAPDAFRQ